MPITRADNNNPFEMYSNALNRVANKLVCLPMDSQAAPETTLKILELVKEELQEICLGIMAEITPEALQETVESFKVKRPGYNLLG